ncbi:nitrite reductase large subunit NirB [Acidiphilium acidophilum]|uniref:Nitrite reductase large subunit NirB n=1 Tax=Acidiphilium acidophilum TaxID=76588 RepID=A0AAW9DS67_ACIAO|nr:nitrite reductase large subunit NirB [Acidiphilium acidophilum]MDX5932054.1 nitrite reductase large subunit NirB [Acidiphilium acidophilum]GBQ13864.1 nitrite reductase large subunit [Acidiphilium acidophilum DSM 700]
MDGSNIVRPRLVVIGNGMAGMRTVEDILAIAPGYFDITVFGGEPQPNYDRIMLSPLLAGGKSFADIVLNDYDWYKSNNIRLIAGEHVDWIDRKQRVVRGAKGSEVPYDMLLLATGSNPFVLPIPGADKAGVLTFRTVADVEDMLAVVRQGTRAVVIGGGLLGLEAAHGLNLRGADVTVIHLMPTLMERQLDPSAAHLLEFALSKRGMTILTATETAAFEGDERVSAVRLKDGTAIPADLVVMAVGIRPNAGLARAVGIECNRGVLVDDWMRTSDPAIFAIGECVEHNGQVFGLVAPIWEMAKVAARAMTNAPGAGFTPVASVTRLKVSGVDMVSAGAFMGDATTDDIVLRDAARGIYKRLVLRENRIVGMVCIGDARDAAWHFQLMKDEADIEAFRDSLIFGPVGDGPADPDAAVLAMPDNAEICGCNGVCKGKIVASIGEFGLATIEDVRAKTKASSSCGSCTGLVEALLRTTLGESYAPAAVKPMCKCTDLPHDEVRRRIVGGALKSIAAVMQALEWHTPDGCASCRPALNYYLICAWPGEYVDDQQSRFVNERMHANIQKDGTYSVVPRMWGGLTSSRELRAIADVVDKYSIPEVKITGGQRIDMLGVKREDLTAVWRDLNAAGLVSGHAYGKALRTVKTCVGSEWCRFGTQNSTAMGVALERMSWGSWSPHKFKMAVSGCPRNCAEATIKDFGVIATEAGWDLLVGGNGGIKLRGTDLLCKVTTDAEVIEYCAAFMQVYREEARYLERTAPWIERVGIDYVRQRVVEDHDGRRALAARFHHAQTFAQFDPWAQQSTGPEPAQYSHVAELV